MKQVPAILLLLILGASLIYVTRVKKVTPPLSVAVCSIPSVSKVLPVKVNVKYKGGITLYTYKMGFKESGNNPEAVNSIGAIGTFQFTENTLIDLGYSHITADKFKEDKSIFTLDEQNKAFIKLLKRNKKLLVNTIKKYDCTFYKGIVITESGILAAAHLAGPGGVIKFFESDENKKDIYGTTVSSYMKEFSSYKLN